MQLCPHRAGTTNVPVGTQMKKMNLGGDECSEQNHPVVKRVGACLE